MDIQGTTSSLLSSMSQSVGNAQVTGSIRHAVQLDGSEGTGQANQTGSVLNTFGDMLKTQMNQINQLQANADSAVETYAVGGDIELHNVILAVEKADMALQLATQIRNKMVSAYQEISRMSV
ncbi:MAG: flagellar hook-basal body complex protein FliE [Candidatus Melainabacteria bacterium]